MSAIPDDFWREIPCGHPPSPVAVLVTDCGGCTDAHWACHCGWALDPVDAIGPGTDVGAPGPIVPCSKCGCCVALQPAATAPTSGVPS